MATLLTKKLLVSISFLSFTELLLHQSIQKHKQDWGWISSIALLEWWSLKKSFTDFCPIWQHHNLPAGWKLATPNKFQLHSTGVLHWSRAGLDLALDSGSKNPNPTQPHKTPSSFMTTSDQELRSIIHVDDDMSGRTTALGRTAEYLRSVTTQRKPLAKLTATIVFKLFQFVGC